MSNFVVDPNFRGIQGARAYHAALTLVRSFYYLPTNKITNFAEMCGWFDTLEKEKRREVLHEAIHHGAMLEADEIEALLCFAKDKNGIPIKKESIKNFTPFEINEALLEVSSEIFEQKLFFCQTNK